MRPERDVGAAGESSAHVLACARASIRNGSRSFALASRLLPRQTRDGAVLLYAWCRHCDDVIDGQQGGMAGVAPARAATPVIERLAELRRRTTDVLDGRPAGDPVFAGLAVVLERHPIPAHLLFEHLDGFAMDARGVRFATIDELLGYCWRVAGTVGVMMATIMGVRDEATLDRASDLGIAFQLTNIARDVIDDARMGRVYLPEAWLRAEGIGPHEVLMSDREALHRATLRLLDRAEPYYASSRIGIRALPPRCAWAIATAARTYRRIGTIVRTRGAAAWDSRASTSLSSKLGLAFVSGVEVLGSRGVERRSAASRGALWTRPRHRPSGS